MYQIGQLVMYRKDVCEIKNMKKYNGEDYYTLNPVKDESLKISIPITSKDLRTIISKEEIEQIMKKMPEIETIETEDKIIEHTYKNLLFHGSHEDLIKIIKTTYLRNKERLEKNKKVSEKRNTSIKQKNTYIQSFPMLLIKVLRKQRTI